MKGLALAEAYYRECGAPAIRERFGAYDARIAAGLVGPGSECFGFDDEISRDHDWGPGFCLWLSDEDHALFGEELQRLYEGLPAVFMGFGPRVPSPGEEWRVGVSRVSAFFGRFTGLARPPRSVQEWLRIPEHSLASCTNGKVFIDPPGEFTRFREALLSYYPEDIRLKKIASRCVTIAQSGQYNYRRSIERGELFAAMHAEASFCADVLSLAFLLNRRYAPFYKWMHRAVKSLPLLGDAVHEEIDRLVRLPSEGRGTALASKKVECIESLCSLLVEELRRQCLSDAEGDFLLEHARSVHARIADPLLGERLTVVP